MDSEQTTDDIIDLIHQAKIETKQIAAAIRTASNKEIFVSFDTSAIIKPILLMVHISGNEIPPIKEVYLMEDAKNILRESIAVLKIVKKFGNLIQRIFEIEELKEELERDPDTSIMSGAEVIAYTEWTMDLYLELISAKAIAIEAAEILRPLIDDDMDTLMQESLAEMLSKTNKSENQNIH